METHYVGHRKGVQTLQCINSVWHNELAARKGGHPFGDQTTHYGFGIGRGSYPSVKKITKFSNGVKAAKIFTLHHLHDTPFDCEKRKKNGDL